MSVNDRGQSAAARRGLTPCSQGHHRWVAGQRMTDARLRSVLDELYPTTEGPAPLGKAALARSVEARDTVTYLFKHAPTVGNAPGSKWAAANALVEYLDHYRPSRGDRFARIVDERGNPKAKALQSVLAA